MELKDRLREVRKMKNETQVDAARVLGIAQNQYSRYENGTDLNHRYLTILCEHWNISADYVLGLTDTPSPIHRESPVSN